MVEVNEIESNPSILCAADGDLTAADAQRLQRRFKHWTADGVEHEIGTLSTGKRANFLGKILYRGVNDCVSVRRIVGMSGGADHTRFLPMRDLCGGAANSTRDSNDKDGFALLNIADVHERRPRGQVSNPDGRGLLHG